MNCNDAEQLIVQLVYDELEGDRKDDVQTHIESCNSCRETYDELKESSVILSDSFSDLEDLKLTDEELVEILSVSPGDDVDATDPVEDVAKDSARKRPIYFNSTFGIAASLLVTCGLLLVIYWSRIKGAPNLSMVTSESYDEKMAPASTPPVLEEMDAVEELVIEEEIGADNYYANIGPTEHDAPSVNYEKDMTRPADVSDDAPTTDDNATTEDVLDVVASNRPLNLSGTMGGRSTTFAGKGGKPDAPPKTPGSTVVNGTIISTDGHGVTYGNKKPAQPAPSQDKIVQDYLAKKWKAKERQEGERKDISKELSSGETRRKEANKSVFSLKNKPEATFKNSIVRDHVKGNSRILQDSTRSLSDQDMTADLLADGPEDKGPDEINQLEIIHRRRLQKEADKVTAETKKDAVGNEYDNSVKKKVAKQQTPGTIDSEKQKRLKEGLAENETQNGDPFAGELVAKGEVTAGVNSELTFAVTADDDIEVDVVELEELESEVTVEPMRESFFKPVPVNPFVMTQEDALSTFALDTDTAAYTIARNYILQGYLPPAGSVRTEEFVNAFDYNYPNKTGNTFTVHAEAAPSPFGNDLALVKVGVKGKVIGREGRKASHLVFAIDTSGSMERKDRMPLLKKGLNTLLDNLDPRDRISLVTYGRDSRLVLDNVAMTQVDTIRTSIKDIQCGGSTNLHQGVQFAYKIAKQNFRSGGINSVILCSDGMANIGDQTADRMVDTADTYRKQGISFNSVGFGMGNYNDNILETMANKGDGSYVFIDSAKTAVEFFTNELGNRLNVIARDAKIQVKFDPSKVRRYRLLGYENRDIKDKDFRNDSVDAGEVGSGQSATALYEVEVLKNTDVRDLGTVFIRYRNTATDKVEEINSRLRADMVRKRTVKDDPRFFLAAAVSEFAEILRDSEYAKDGSIESVQRLAEQVAVHLPLDARVQEFLHLVRRAKGLPRAK